MDTVPTDVAHRDKYIGYTRMLLTNRHIERQVLLTKTDVHQEHNVHQKLLQGGLDVKLRVLSCVLSQGCSPES